MSAPALPAIVLDHARAAYQQGTALTVLARSLGVSVRLLRAALLAAGETIRATGWPSTKPDHTRVLVPWEMGTRIGEARDRKCEEARLARLTRRCERCDGMISPKVRHECEEAAHRNRRG